MIIVLAVGERSLTRIVGVESARHKSFQPQGYIAAGSEVAGDWRGGIFDAVALGVGDGWVGSQGGSARTTKVRVSLPFTLIMSSCLFTRCIVLRVKAMSDPAPMSPGSPIVASWPMAMVLLPIKTGSRQSNTSR